MKYSALISLPAIFAFAACSDSSTAGPKDAPDIARAAAPAVTQVAEMSLEERGTKIYKRCRACHTLDQDGRNKVGPNLWNIYGSTAGQKEGYAYSKAMLASEIVWDAETMDAYLKKPAQYVPGTKMSFIGLKKQEDRDAVQAYMRANTTP